MFYLLAVVVIAFKRSLKAAIFTSIVGVIAFDFFFVPPYLTFRLSDTQYLVTFLGMIIVGTVISMLVTRAKKHGDAAQVREKETSTLYALSQDLAIAMDAAAIMRAVGQHIREIFQWESVFFIPENGLLVVQAKTPGLVMDVDDIAVATWAFQHGSIAGYDTDTLHGSKLRYIPLRSTRGVLGILAVQPIDPTGVITYEQSRILTAFANQAALALERVNLAKTA